MPIPFDGARNGETPGVIGFLRLLNEEQGKGIRAALFATSALQLPLEFCFTRVDVADSVLWEEGQARRVAIVSLIRELFRSINRTPDVILGLADEIPPLVFSEAGLSHMNGGELGEQVDQESVVPTGPFQFAPHGAFAGFQPRQVQRQFPQ